MEYTFLLLLLFTHSPDFINNNNHILCHAIEHPLPISTPTFGGCYNSQSQSITSCAFGPTCPSNNNNNNNTLTYLPPNNLTILLHSTTTTTTTNPCHNPITIPIGRCASPKDFQRCSPFQTNCLRTSEFIPPPTTDQQCGITTEWTQLDDITRSKNKGSASEYPRCGTEIQELPPQKSEDSGGGGGGGGPVVFDNNNNQNDIDPEDRRRRTAVEGVGTDDGTDDDNYDYNQEERELQGADDDAASNTIKTRCVLNQDACVIGEEEFLTIREEPIEDPCFCHDVPVGLCHLNAEEGGDGGGNGTSITADGSFCAVGEYDCPPSYNWTSAYELDNMKNPPRICRLCHNMYKVESLFYERVVDSGGCYSENLVFQRCALERTDCRDSLGEQFLDGRDMRERGHVPCPAEEITGGSCSATITGITNLTELTTTVEICTNGAASCRNPEEFVPRDSCTIHHDLAAEDATPAVFGSCTFITDEEAEENPSRNRCVWRKEDCESDEEYNPVQPSAGIRCQCEDVQTGACHHASGGTDDYTCAVSYHGCTDPGSYITSSQLRRIGIDCRLCHPHRPIVRVFPSQPPSVQPSRASDEPSGQPSLSQLPSGAPVVVVPYVIRESRYMVYSSIGGIFAMVTLIIILFRGVVGGNDRADMKLLKTLKKLKKKPTHTTHTN